MVGQREQMSTSVMKHTSYQQIPSFSVYEDKKEHRKVVYFICIRVMSLHKERRVKRGKKKGGFFFSKTSEEDVFTASHAASRQVRAPSSRESWGSGCHARSHNR